MEIVNCSIHGEHHSALICQHLSKSSCVEVHFVPEEGEEEATFWCPKCEEARNKDHGWYDYADEVASWKLVCKSCFDEIINGSEQIHEHPGSRTPDIKPSFLKRIASSYFQAFKK